MTAPPNTPFDASKVLQEHLREKMRHVLADVANEAKRMSGSTENKLPSSVAAALEKCRGRRSDDATIIEGISSAILEVFLPVIEQLIEQGNAHSKALEAPKAGIALLAHAYKGVWSQAEYGEGSLCTYKGHLWLAMADTSDQPDTAPNAWKMIMRKPRDGRDGKDRQ